MTHLAIYQANKSINALIHILNWQLWQDLMDKFPTTKTDVPYGSPEMAKEIFRLFQETNVKEEKIIIMGGHEEGIITFGLSLEEAGNLLLNFINNNNNYIH